MTEVFRLCDDYVTRWAALDPVAAGMRGLNEAFGAATDYGPDGYAAREELTASTLAALGPMAVISDADRLAAAFLRERLEAQLAWHRTGEPLRSLRTPIGQISTIRDSVDLLPRDGEQDWRNIAARLTARHRGAAAPGRGGAGARVEFGGSLLHSAERGSGPARSHLVAARRARRRGQVRDLE